MEPQASLLITLALAFVVAFVLGLVAARLRLPPMVGYLVAGIAIGPNTSGLVHNTAIAGELADIGVILLMFGVGLHFSTADLSAVKWIAVPGAIIRSLLTTTMGAALALVWGWSFGASLVLGLSLSIASTVVVLRALEERADLETVNGRVAVAWSVVEDLVTVLILALLPALAKMSEPSSTGAAMSGGSLVWLIALTVGKVAVFLALVAWAGPRAVPWLLRQAARSGSHELFTLAVLTVSLGIAYGSAALFGVSFALGAFCAGVVLSNTELSHRAAEESLPLQHAFSVIFFVSVGMLFDPTIIVRDPLAVIGVVLIIMVGKSLLSLLFVQAIGYPIGLGLKISAYLAQIGEFSFILAGIAISLGLMPAESRDLILAGALISVTLNPIALAAVKPLQAWIRGWQRVMVRFEPAQELRLARLQATLDAHKKAGAKAGLQPDELLSRWKIFGDLDPPKRAELLGLFKPRSAVPGERLIRKGDIANEVFFISSGTVEVSVGRRKVKLGPGDFFGEMALLNDAPRSADVTAIDYCQLLTLDRRDFQEFVGKHPELHAKIDEVATSREEMNKLEDATGHFDRAKLGIKK